MPPTEAHFLRCGRYAASEVYAVRVQTSSRVRPNATASPAVTALTWNWRAYWAKTLAKNREKVLKEATSVYVQGHFMLDRLVTLLPVRQALQSMAFQFNLHQASLE